MINAPYKLYISQLIYETWQYQTPDPDDNTEVEYIRKDALLEWAEEEMMKAARSSEAYGRRNAFMDVIDKLNEM